MQQIENVASEDETAMNCLQLHMNKASREIQGQKVFKVKLNTNYGEQYISLHNPPTPPKLSKLADN